ncbi:homeobox-leucine zipper protein GLABRA 2 [Dorcoceras hygrometricum]|uniref:Homeobox-leucine zipper protein GLABRA 2 n=1 Tax=Dorcoceras hygrometricum TaxID=472368 RepID=A0A2Z7DFB8_9LAMI|nr:homeobox-leucine zipper protein GLABRA 2 [Dorcoceras hygrometricum]
MSDSPNSRHARDFLSTPHLSLSLAGIFRDAGAAAYEVGERAEKGGGGKEETVEISSENSGPGNDDFEMAEGEQQNIEDDEDEEGDGIKEKKRKKYHRHTPSQIGEMEALFKESPHPDEKQRLYLSKQLGLHPRQVKFWFQNRRTQIKAIQERHESTLLKTEIEKLRQETKALREAVKNSSCPNCGFSNTTKDVMAATEEEQKLRVENAKLKAEVERLRTMVGKYYGGTSPNSSSHTSENDQGNRGSLEFYKGIFGFEKSRILDAANQAMDELQKMATYGEPLWVRSYESGREILNYDEYRKQICAENSSSRMQGKKSVEASRDSRVVFVDLPWLVQSFMDANQWKELFPNLISRAATVDIFCHGEGVKKDGAVHLIFAEIQILTPMVATREMYFIRYSKQLSAHQWAITDVSIDRDEDNTETSVLKCRKCPSGCIIEDNFNGHCKVIWVEHVECQKSTVNSMYRSIINSGQAFGAKHWISTLQQQCERHVFYMATNVPTKDSSGVTTLAGRKSILKLAQRMTASYCRALNTSSYNSWNKIASKTGDDIRVASRKNVNDPGEPNGVILCAATSVWLPVAHHVLFDYLRDENQRKEWDIMFNGSAVQSVANIAKGQVRGNAVTVLAMKGDEHNMWVLQDSATNAYESTVIYAPVDINGMQSVMTGCDSNNIAILPSGFSIIADGIESRPSVIGFSPEEKCTEGGSLLTIAFQILLRNSPTAKLSAESVESVNTLISCTLQNIKRSLQCED